MQVSKFLLLIVAVVLFASCKKTIEERVIYDNVIYEMNNVVVYSSSSEKVKQKTPVQYISILYADLFNARIPNNELNNLTLISTAIGDKTMANELILSHYLNSPNLQLPGNEEMLSNIPAFVDEVYVRFYQRNPTPYEKLYLTNLIEEDESLTVQLIYTSFVLSNEYYFY
jgi:hypothetical protein